jgi:hypothetical protein
MKSLIGLAAEAEPMARRQTLRQAKRRRRWDKGEAFMRKRGTAREAGLGTGRCGSNKKEERVGSLDGRSGQVAANIPHQIRIASTRKSGHIEA